MVTMKIYNEVVYQIVDNQLVKVSEDSFDYEGEVSKCKGGGGTTGKIIKKVAKTVDPIIRNEFIDTANNLYDSTGGFIADQATRAAKNNNLDKPGGNVKSFTDWARSVSGKGELIAWGTNSTDATPEVDGDNTVYEGGEDDASAELTAQRRQQNNMRGRGAANQTSGQSASLLTK